MTARGSVLAAVLAASCALATGCAGRAPDDTAGFVIVGIGAGPNGFDPRLTSDEGSERVAQLVYSRLMELDDALRIAAARIEKLRPAQTDAPAGMGEQPYIETWVANAITAGATVEEIASLMSQLFVYVGTLKSVTGFNALAAVRDRLEVAATDDTP